MRFLVLLMAFGSAHAGDWQTKDTGLLAGAFGLLVVDWAQTLDIARTEQVHYSTPACADPATRSQPWAGACTQQRRRVYNEYNPFLGREPSVAEVNRYFIAALGGTALISYAMPTKYRRYFLGGVIVLESLVVLHNHRIGLHISY